MQRDPIRLLMKIKWLTGPLSHLPWDTLPELFVERGTHHCQSCSEMVVVVLLESGEDDVDDAAPVGCCVCVYCLLIGVLLLLRR